MRAEEQALDEKSEAWILGTAVTEDTQAQSELPSEAKITSHPPLPLPRLPIWFSGLAGWSTGQLALFLFVCFVLFIFLNRQLSRGHRLLRNRAVDVKWSENSPSGVHESLWLCSPFSSASRHLCYSRKTLRTLGKEGRCR